jgi:8-oxo-dGTP pyrophosphatase MutT (NUDIX family)
MIAQRLPVKRGRTERTIGAMTPDLPLAVEAIEPFDWRRAAVRELALFLARRVPDLAERTTLPVHATASVLIVDPAGERVLLVWHPKFDRWLQPGGHCDGETDVRAVALREAREETGLELELGETPFDVDLHPGDPSGGPHVHLDVRFVARLDQVGELRSPEGLDLRWFASAELVGTDLEDVTRAALEWRTRR